MNDMHRAFRLIIYGFAIVGFVFVAGYTAIRLGLTKTDGIIDEQRLYFQNELSKPSSTWQQGEEWGVLKEAISKDRAGIKKAGDMAGVPPRIIVSILIVEQLRLYHSDRELFKKVFAPLQLLGNQSQFSWGVMGIKRETAEKIEGNLKNSASAFYLGKSYENLLDFSASNIHQERFHRLTNEENRYYSYLYSGLMIRELIEQWKRAGYPIADKVGIIATLFNIGFENSNPKTDPHVGGSEVEINKTTYSFGGLAQLFYDSDELIEEFPR